MKEFNGVDIRKTRKEQVCQSLYEKNYQYRLLNLSKGKIYQASKINTGSIALMSSPYKNSKIKINDKEIKLSKFRFFIFNLKKIKIESNSRITLGIAGLKKKIVNDKIKNFREKDIYKVNKPWGYELWINGKSSEYSFKKIFLKKGHRTSLQFHKKKIETNFLYKGSAELTLSKKNGKYKKEEIIKNIYKKRLAPGCYINVNNYAVHRLKAISDIILFEVSTPHLDDVIRLADDKKRKDGKISKEHKN